VLGALTGPLIGGQATSDAFVCLSTALFTFTVPWPAAAVMIADVSGFTALTESLGAQGSAGVELLTKCMNRYFTQVLTQAGVGGA
jgi:hypothetical protein